MKAIARAFAIGWLSDNGSIYTSDETRAFGAEIGFVMCTTPPSCVELATNESG